MTEHEQDNGGEGAGGGHPVEPVEPVGALLRSVREQTAHLRVHHAQLRQAIERLHGTAGALQGQLHSERLPLVLVSPDGAVRAVNPAARRLLGCDEPACAGQPFAELVEESDRARWQAMLGSVNEGYRTTELELCLTHPSGESVPVLAQLGRVREAPGEGAAIGVVLRDSPERRRMQRDLVTANEELQRRACQLLQLAERLDQAEFEHRRRVADFLHDDVQQMLVAAKIQIRLAHGDRRREEALGRADEMLDQVLNSLHAVAAELRPPKAARQGLPAAIDWAVGQVHEQHGLEVRVEHRGPTDRPIPDALCDMVMRAVRELLFNVVKHAGVESATVVAEVEPDGSRVRLTVHDHGRGFDPRSGRREGLGLFAIRERAELWGGRLEVRSVPGDGTLATLEVPTRRPEMPEECQL